MILKKLLYSAIAVVTLAFCYSCRDDLTLDSSSNQSGLWDMSELDPENTLVVPLSISIDQIVTPSRASFDDEGYNNGSSFEHTIDFHLPNECFAIFFDENDKFMYIRPLVSNSSLGNGMVPAESDAISEFVVYALSYIQKPENWEPRDQKENESDEEYNYWKEQWDSSTWETDRYSLLPKKILVVLNGGRVYRYFSEFFNIDPLTGLLEEDAEELDTKKILDFKWNYLLGATEEEEEEEQNSKTSAPSATRLRPIGINSYGHYTMTNSAYYGPTVDPEDSNNNISDYSLQTVSLIDRSKICDAYGTNIDTKNSSATIYVERMVAKFTAPKFETEVIGSDKIFRPSGDAQSVIIYNWLSDGTLHSQETKWRIHVLGWTINGREKENYLFKHIKDAYGEDENGNILDVWGNLKNWDRALWNNPERKRSFWSVDPHYSTDPADGFYPWQYRGALDKEGISWVHGATSNENTNPIALRYLTFNEVMYWDDQSLTISENTFYPYLDNVTGDDRTTVINNGHAYNNPNYMDSRATLLRGPHLLVTAELYLESSNVDDDNYIGKFSGVTNLYADRYFRYYTTEMDCFRMFLKDINDALRTQSQMSFKYYNWGNTYGGNDNPDEYVALPTGYCTLMFDCELDESNPVDYLTWSDEEKEIYGVLKAHSDDFHLKPVVECIDKINELNAQVVQIPLFMEAQVKDGDSRKIPWIPGMVFRKTNNKQDILKVYNKTQYPEENGRVYETEWTNDLRKSLIFEWYGTVDHYYRGYMYYAADIPHYLINQTTREGYYGAVRNHQYSFTIKSINSLGTPVDDPNLRIIPARYNYRDQMSVHLEPFDFHTIPSVSVQF